MKLSESEYNKIRNDPWIKDLIDEWLIPLIIKSDSERLKDKKTQMKRDQNWLNELLKNAKNIQTILLDDPELSRILGIELIKVEHGLTNLKKYYKYRVRDRRASPKKAIFSVLILIFNTLADMGLGQTKQIDFIYRIYEENNFENYATANENVKKALQDRIRKDQEKAVK